jgi:hypothetical protein
MGLIRGALLVFASVIFFFAVLSSAMFFIISASLEYSAVQNQTVNIAEQLSNQINLTQELNSRLATIRSYCGTKENYVFRYGNYTFRISCGDTNKSMSAIIDSTINNFVRDLYYENYNCNYWDCIDKYSLTFLISEKSRSYWQNWLYYSMTALIISAAALFLLIKKKRHSPFLIGATMLFSSAIILAIVRLLKSISNPDISQMIMIFFSKSNYVFVRLLIIGAIIMLIGLAMELFHVEFKIYNLLSKFWKSKEPENKTKPQNTKNQDKK